MPGPRSPDSPPVGPVLELGEQSEALPRAFLREILEVRLKSSNRTTFPTPGLWVRVAALRRFLILSLPAALLLSAPVEIRTGVFRGQPVTYKIVDGWAIFEGDIILGRAEELESGKLAGVRPVESSVRTGQQFLWTNATVPYVIDSAIPNPQRVGDAIQHWNDKTPLKLIPRTNEVNFVRFGRTTGYCSSSVGMIGGQQAVNVIDTCTAGMLIHEIGHTIGLFHEQSRHDRDTYVNVLFENIDKREVGNFGIPIADDIGPYDYSSIMHYDAYGLSRNSQPTIETNPPGIPIGQRAGLSVGDLDTVFRLYGQAPTSTTIGTNPAGLQITVDGVSSTAPQTFNWSPGSAHTIAVPFTLQGGPRPRYVFARWSDNGAQSHSITASASTTVYTANFIRQFLFKTGVSGSGTVTVTPSSPDGYYPDRTRVQIAAFPSAGSYFYRWTGTTYLGANGQSASPAALRVTVPDSNYIASFSTARPYTVTSNPLARFVTLDGTRLAVPLNQFWTPGSPHTVSVDTSVLDGNGTTRYLFTNWSDGGAASHTITAPVSPAAFTVNFTTQYLLTTSVSPPNSGTLLQTPLSSDGFYDKNTSVQLQGTPAAGFTFANWTGDLTGTVNPQFVLMDDQRLVTAVFSRATSTNVTAITNGASFRTGPAAVGEIVTLFGANIGPDPLVTLRITSAGRFDTTLADTQVLFDNIAAPLIYVFEKQVSAIVPYSLANKSSTLVQLVYRGRRSNPVLLALAPASPALFTANASGTGPGAILNQDYSLNTASNPAPKDSIVMLYATGEGQTDPAGVDGKLATGAYPKPVLPVSVRIGGVAAEVFYAGAAPTYVAGLLQVNVKVPLRAPSGPAVPVTLVVGNTPSPPGVTLAIR
ncbi:MAG: hypothetical protein HY238_06360 [Acidobacteria bacterium]|nr:hypothetical protein [Acidobacteriota bacterium]